MPFVSTLIPPAVMPRVLWTSRHSPFAQVAWALYKIPFQVSSSIYWFWGAISKKLSYLGFGSIGAEDAPILPLFNNAESNANTKLEIDVDTDDEGFYSFSEGNGSDVTQTIDHDNEPEVSS